MPENPKMFGISFNRKIPKIIPTIDLYALIGPSTDISPFSRAFIKKPLPVAPSKPTMAAHPQKLKVTPLKSEKIIKSRLRKDSIKYVIALTNTGLIFLFVNFF